MTAAGLALVPPPEGPTELHVASPLAIDHFEARRLEGHTIREARLSSDDGVLELVFDDGSTAEITHPGPPCRSGPKPRGSTSSAGST